MIVKNFTCLFFLSFCVIFPVYGQYYPYPFDAPVHRLQSLRTENFRIIFSEESRSEALQIASFAEEEFQDFQKRYGVFTNIGGAIRVVVSKDTQLVNGFATPVPVPTMHIYAPRPPSSSTSIGNLRPMSLRLLFRHELTHIIVLSYISQKTPRIGYFFGNIRYPNVFLASLSLIEGAAVRRESDGGYGRLNDPYHAFLLRRDFYGKKPRLRRPDQSSGADRSFGVGHLPYTYGSFFYQYLDQESSENFDKEIWEQLSRIRVSSHAVPLAVRSREDAKKMPFSKIWDDFEGHYSNLLPPLQEAQPLLSFRKRAIHSLSLRGDNLYYYNAQIRQLRRIHLPTGKDRFVLFGTGVWDKVDISSDESLVLVSGTSPRRRLVKNYTVVLNLKSGIPVQKPVYGLAEASFAPDAGKNNIRYAALRLGSTLDLVLREGSDERILLQPRDTFQFDSPVIYQGHVYFSAFFQGGYSLMRLSLQNGALEILDAPLGYIRFLSSSSEALSFAYAEGVNQLYKTAYISQGSLVRLTNNLKGEMLESAVSQDHAYVKGSFGDRDNISVLSTAQAPRGEAVFRPVALPAIPSRSPIEIPSQTYRPGIDLAPHFWLPFANLQEMGIIVPMFDATGSDLITLALGIDFYKGTPQFQGEWLHTSLPIDIRFTVFNRYNHFAAVRNHLVSAGLTLSLPLQTALNGQGSLDVFFTWNGRFTGSDSLHPYQWNVFFYRQIIYGGSFSWIHRTPEGRPHFYREASFSVRALSDALNPSLWRIEGFFRFSPPVLPLSMEIHGAYDTAGLLPSGSGLLGAALMPFYREYADLRALSLWAFYGSVELTLIPIEINRGIGMGEVFFNGIDLFAGYRAGYWPAQGLLQAVYARLDIRFSLLYGNLSLTLSQELSYALTRSNLSYNINIGASLPF